MPPKSTGLSTTKKAAFGRKLPGREQVMAMASLLGPEITNLALAQIGGQSVPLASEPYEVTETKAVLSQILSEMSNTIKTRIDEVTQGGGISNLNQAEREEYFSLLASAGADISALETRWEKVSGFAAQRDCRAALVTAVTSAVVEAVTPVVQITTEEKSQTNSNKVDSIIFEIEESGKKSIPVQKLASSNSASALDFDV
jgi:hypothetical protein